MTLRPKKNSEFILIELNKAVKGFRIYPESHPTLKTLLEKTFQEAKKALENSQDITISIERKTFYEEEKELSIDTNITNLAQEFFLRRIKKLTFSRETNPKDWIGLMRLLNTDPKSIMNLGGAERFIIQKGVRGIWLNEISYEDIVSKATELEEELQEERDEEKGMISEDAAEREEPHEEEIEEEVEEDTELADFIEGLEESEVLKDRGEDLDTLLTALKEERDNTKYKQIVSRLVGKGIILKEDNQVDDLVKILYIFSDHSNPDSNRPRKQQESSYKGLRNLFDPDTSTILLELFCTKDEHTIEKIKSIILRIGEDMIPYLLDELNKKKEIQARRNLFDLILVFGETAIEHIESRLETDSWFVARQMVSMLGYIGSPHSLAALKNSLDYPDIRVKKEAIKALARLKTVESIQELLNTLSSMEPSLSPQIILSLGAIKEKAAVPSLIDLIKKRDLWGKNHEIKKEALKALGNIGDTRALPVLLDILKKRTLWRKEHHEELQALAALALGSIGGEEVATFLQQILENAHGTVYQSCLKALRWLERSES